MKKYLTSDEVQTLVSNMREGKVTFHFNGHHRCSEPRVGILEDPDQELLSGVLSPQEESWRRVEGEIYRTLQFASWRNREVELPCPSIGFNCYDCGDMPTFSVEDMNNIVLGSPCPHPEGHPEYGNIISIPTGHILYGDALFRDRPKEMESRELHRGVLWEKDISENASTINVAHGFCGNSCPSIYLNEEKGEILIASEVYIEELDECRPFQEDYPGFVQIGGICTDLWWWTICDKSIAEKIGPTNEDGEAHIPAGNWLVRCRYHLEDRDDWSTPTIYARLVLQDN